MPERTIVILTKGVVDDKIFRYVLRHRRLPSQTDTCPRPSPKSRTQGSCGRDRGRKEGSSMISEVQKNTILTLRQQGCSYQEIAGQLILSPNTVKSVCRRRGANAPKPDMLSLNACKNCGVPLPQSIGGRKRAFCCDKCRYAWWNQSRRKQPYRLTCYCCGKEFISYGNRKRKFCSRKCYILSRYGEGLP